MKKLSPPSRPNYLLTSRSLFDFNCLFVALSFVFLLSSMPQNALANNDVVMIRIGNGYVAADHIVKGPLNLFVYTYDRPETIDTGLRVVPAGTVTEQRFFLGVDGEVIEITSSNYKKMIKRHLPNAKHLHKRLGKVGFRFQNLSSMVQFYNNFRVKQQYVYVQE